MARGLPSEPKPSRIYEHKNKWFATMEWIALWDGLHLFRVCCDIGRKGFQDFVLCKTTVYADPDLPLRSRSSHPCFSQTMFSEVKLPKSNKVVGLYLRGCLFYPAFLVSASSTFFGFSHVQSACLWATTLLRMVWTFLIRIVTHVYIFGCNISIWFVISDWIKNFCMILHCTSHCADVFD